VFDYHALLPELILGVTLLAVLGVELVTGDDRKWLAGVVGLVGVIAAIVPLLTLAGCRELFGCASETRLMFGGSYVVDQFALVLKGLFLIGGAVTLLLSVGYLESDRYYQGEFYFLILASVTGAVVMASSRDLITMFVGLELVSAPAFLLAGWRKGDLRSNEASLKFFLMGVLSAAILLFGMSLVYGITGELTFAGIAGVIASSNLSGEPILALGVILMLAGFGFKISAVPFHFWAPDTYQGAPTPVAAYLSVVSKAAGFVGLITVCYLAFADARQVWGPVLWVLAALSMTVGNLTALRQTNVVRLLGFSSVAQAGFILVPFAMAAVLGSDALGDAFFASITYLLVYAFMNLGAFGAVMAAMAKSKSAEIDDWAGMNRYAPGVAVLLGVFFLSLAGIPPLAGWFAKFVMFRAVLSSGGSWGVVLAAIAAVNSVIALFYYARVVKAVFMDPVPESVSLAEAASRPLSRPLLVALGITAAVVVVAGFFPQVLAFFGEASKSLAVGP
jgi:NADH-quinone oxidoreductase subunit N